MSRLVLPAEGGHANERDDDAAQLVRSVSTGTPAVARRRTLLFALAGVGSRNIALPRTRAPAPTRQKLALVISAA
jgi:hypothetical protein